MTTISNPVPRRSWGLTGDSVRGLIGKIILLGLVAGIAGAMAKKSESASAVVARIFRFAASANSS